MRRKPTTELAGRALAIKMIEEMRAAMDGAGPKPSSIEAMYRPEGTQQDNVLLRYFDAIGGNREALAGFCAVLTDYIGSGEEDCCPSDPSFYSHLTERDITGTPGPWPKMDDEENEQKAAFDSFMTKVLPGGKEARHA